MDRTADMTFFISNGRWIQRKEARRQFPTLAHPGRRRRASLSVKLDVLCFQRYFRCPTTVVEREPALHFLDVGRVLSSWTLMIVMPVAIEETNSPVVSQCNGLGLVSTTNIIGLNGMCSMSKASGGMTTKLSTSPRPDQTLRLVANASSGRIHRAGDQIVCCPWNRRLMARGSSDSAHPGRLCLYQKDRIIPPSSTSFTPLILVPRREIHDHERVAQLAISDHPSP
jgi:hypothetical protein